MYIRLLNIGISYQAFLNVGFSIGHYMMAVSHFSDHELGNGIFKTVPNDEKTSEKYGRIQEVIWKEID